MGKFGATPLDSRVMNLTGIAKPLNEDDLWARMSLELPEYAQVTERSAKRTRYESHFGGELLGRILEASFTPASAECISRFSAVESDTTNRGLKGIGRMTDKAFPRLGGVLPPLTPQQGSRSVSAAVERTLQAGYLVAMSIEKNLGRPVVLSDPTVLWDRWIPLAYNPGTDLNQFVYSVAEVWDFWRVTLGGLGLQKEARSLERKPWCALVSSLSGLATAGSMLAYIERGDGAP